MPLFKPEKSYALSAGLLMLLIASVGSAVEQPVFETPEAAVQAIVEAASADDPAVAIRILGPGAEDLRSGDAVADAADREAFAAAAGEATRIELQGDDLAILNIGKDDWPFAIPMVRADAGWRFDAEAGKEELLNRRIGRNELHAIAVSRAYVEAQYEYADEDRDGDGHPEFARLLMSREGDRDGLYWPTSDGEPESPMGRLIADAVEAGYKPTEGAGSSPYQGYYFRPLLAQGEHAPGGARSYQRDGLLTGGFGLLAYPATYDNSGIMTFMVNQSGIVFQKDLGEDTASTVGTITAYDPDRGWSPVTD